MEFMLLFTNARGTRTSDEEKAAMGSLGRELVQQGKLKGHAPLEPEASGARVRVSGGKAIVTDGPFAESKEVAGGYYIVQAGSRAEAIALASRCPSATWGGVEVRELIPVPSQEGLRGPDPPVLASRAVTDVETLPLEREQVDETACLLATALFDDPAYCAILRDAATRRAGLFRFFAGNLAAHVPHRHSHVRLDGGGSVQATVTLRPPGGIRVSGVALLRGLVPFALAHGVGAIRRMLVVKSLYEGLERRASEGRPYWHVHMMAVLPELQGKGIGGALLDEVLDTAAREPAPIVLTTHKEINVRFYQRAGFRVAHEENVQPTDARPYRVWCMRRDPRSR